MNSEYQRRWRKEHPEKQREYTLRWKASIAHLPRAPATEKQKDYQRQWRRANPAKTKAYCYKWKDKPGNRQRIRDYEKQKRATDLDFRIAATLRCRIRSAMKSEKKTHRSEAMLGCAIGSFRMYLESKFEEGMTWENYGSFWEIDHVLPCAIFDLSNPEHQKRCFHFSNHQPLTVTANRKKHTKTHQNLWAS